jgi:trigger factor
MTQQIETISTLERRVTMSVARDNVDREVGERLKKLARTVRMPGFRQGKVPMKLVAAQYEPQVRGEVLGDAVQKAFSDVVETHQLRVAGYPRIEPGEGAGAEALLFNATFEVYPEFEPGDISGAAIERPVLEVTDAEVDKTIDSIRKQRATFSAVSRGAQSGDRVTIDFTGSLEGVEFPGGKGDNFPVVLGEGRMLPDFETGLAGAAAGEERTFDVAFPEGYQAAELAGKTAQFKVTVHTVEEPVLPVVDDEFARSLGMSEGGVEKMRSEIRENVEREVRQRLAGMTKQRVMQALVESTEVELPKALVEGEIGRLIESMKADLANRGMKVDQLPFDPEMFREQANRRVKLGLIVGEYIKRHTLAAKPDQVRKLVEESARTFEQPFEVIKWVYSQPERLAEFEGMAVEENVVAFVLERAKVEDKAVAFDELMGAGRTA